MDRVEDSRFESLRSSIVIQRPRAGVVLVTFEGHDTGEHGDAPLREIATEFVSGSTQIELYIDARRGKGASVDVSGEWARWLGKHRRHFRHVSMLTGSRFIQLSASFVRKFAELGEVMHLYTDAAAFEAALASSMASTRAS